MSTASLHVQGSAHQARFGEDFDHRLRFLVASAPEPTRLESELDELTLLSVLCHFAGAGAYRPADPVAGWGLEADRRNPRIRLHRYSVHRTTAIVDVVTFRGIALAPDQSVVFDVAVTPMGQG